MARMHLVSRLTSNRISKGEGTKVGRTAGEVRSLGRQLLNSRAPEIAVKFIYARPFIAAA